MKFNLPKEKNNIIKVVGVGGGGGNAVNHMHNQGINGVDFIICNTDQQALDMSPITNRIQLGETLTDGLGAGSNPETGRNSAIESIDHIKEVLGKGTKMVFITAGMGGGTGTGAAPVIAKASRELDILTVGIVTMPFAFEGRKRRLQAEEGIQQMRENVDTLLVINNDKLREIFGNLAVHEAFAEADNVLTTAAKGIAETITRVGTINVDFNDVKTVMKDSGVAIMGSATAKGEDRALKAVNQALASPLLNDNKIEGAKYVLLNITYGSSEVLMDEITDITDYIQNEAGLSADVIWGYGQDETMEDDSLNITLIATGFNKNPDTGTSLDSSYQPQKRMLNLNQEVEAPIQKNEPVRHMLGSDEPMLKSEIESPKAEEEKVEEEPKALFRPSSSPIEDSIAEEESDEGFKSFLRPEVKDSEDEFPVSSFPSSAEDNVAHFSSSSEEHKEEEKAEEADNDRSWIKDESSAEDEESQTTIEFELEKREEVRYELKEEPEARLGVSPDEPFIRKEELEEEPYAKQQEESPSTDSSISPEERQLRAQERMMNLKNLSMRLKSPNGITDMENVPAYVRRQIDLNDAPHSSESQVSRYTLSESEGEDGEKKTDVKPNNRFLHDNVD
uniref:Cell division protein FtsZ n=1 Tax=uncultured Flavobacteriia bacterium TaxID=212695 RepID=H6RFV4_9BACT|nr:cell division protein FtsZ [uncultured bacterium]CCF99915.1 cell division protein FtsZ [uncultured Flavobacteriia bacterium]